MDIAELADYVIKWLIPAHPKLQTYPQYLERARKRANIYHCDVSGRPECIDEFLDGIDGVLYIEHPIFRKGHFGGYDLVDELEQRGIPVFGIPMWEWWPDDEDWSLKTNAIWSVTNFTNNYLRSLAIVLKARGLSPKWSERIYGDRWGVNLDDFTFRGRSAVERVVFVRGNAGFKDRKASDIILPVLQRVASQGVSVTIYTQAAMPHGFASQELLTLKHGTLPDRKDVYQEGDLFVFCSYWEGLCHGIYEACLSGGLVATTDFPPMNECLPAFKIPVSTIKTEKLGKKIAKAIINTRHLEQLILKLHLQDCSLLSSYGHQWVSQHRSLRDTLQEMHNCLSRAL